MFKQFKLTLTIVATAVCALVSNAGAGYVCFNFNQLPSGSSPASIESYMESVYGSDITVLNAIVGNGSGPLGPDSYTQNNPSYEKHWFSISFNEAPITAVSFDWAMNADAFHAFATYVGDDDEVEFFTQNWSSQQSGNSSTIHFNSPVKTLKFTDSCLGKIQLDNLCVKSIPEPATVCLLGLSGLVFLCKHK